MTLNILVLGAGATGGYFGGRLAQAAHLGKADIAVSFLVRPEAAHIVGDMLARANAAGADTTMLQAAWVHLQTRDVRLKRETPAGTA